MPSPPAEPPASATPPGADTGSAEQLHALSVRKLQHSYSLGLLRTPRACLHGISLEIEAGLRIGLVGPNGSGKSTLLRIAAGLQRPTQGSVSVFGRSLEEDSVRRRIGYVCDHSPFPPELSARYVLELFHRLQRLPERTRAARRERCQAQLERAGLGEDAHRPLGTFSRGMLRRFALAQAFLQDPELLLLDEPTAGLDAPGYDVLEGFLDEARARGATVVLATHTTSDLLAFTDHMVVLVDGRILRQGDPVRLLEGTRSGRSMGELFRRGELGP